MSASTPIVGVLSQSPIFSGVDRDTLQAITGIVAQRAFDEGDTIYRLGDDAREVYLVGSGRVRFTLGVANRPGASGSILTDGQVFGWAALLEDQPRRLATAVCLEGSLILALDGGRLLEIFDRDTTAGYLVMRRLAAMIAHNFMELISV